MNVLLPTRKVEIRVFHFFGGLGGGAKGFNQGHARVDNLEAEFRCIGGVDVDRAAVRDFERLADAPGTVLDLFDRPQYISFHGKEPPADWREATADDIRKAAGGEYPNIIFTSPPCKGFSGLLSEARSASEKYQALNRLTVRSVMLALEAWADNPPEFFILENVPRIATRGRHLLDAIVALLRSHGYSVAETTHDCGELGGLAQTRRRFLLVARHAAKVPPFLYEPRKRPLRSVGEVLGALPLPGDLTAGPMHRMRELQWKTWVRLAFVEAGGDWRSLQKLRIADGHLVDFGLLPDAEWHRSVLGVCPWDRPTGTVTGRAGATTGRFAVADPRCEGWSEYGQLGVTPWDGTASTVTSQRSPGQGRFAVADPRLPENDARHLNLWRVSAWDRSANTIIGATRPGSGAACVADPRLRPDETGPRYNNVYRVVRWDMPRPAVTGGGGPSAGGLAVADPRAGSEWAGRGKYKVTAFDAPAGAVIAASTTGNGGFAVADPRTGLTGERYQTAGHYGVIPWDAHSRGVVGAASHDNGPFNVADPRTAETDLDYSGSIQSLPAADARLVARIRSMDGTWHRPFTTLELAALQGLVEPDEHLELHGTSDSAWRERIGNAVPAPAAAAIASVMAQTLLLAWSGETFVLSSENVWCRPLVVAVSVDVPRDVA